jgi:hypothetical protein
LGGGVSVALTEQQLELAARLKITRDRVLVKLVPYVHPLLATPSVQIQKGVVISTGYGRRERRKTEFRSGMGEQEIRRPNGKVMKFGATRSANRTLYFEDGPETGRILPLQVKPGDVIEFGFRNVEIVDFDRIPDFYNLQLGELVFIWHESIYSIDPEEDMERVMSQAMLFQKSAGHDRHGNFMSGAEDWHRA